MYPSLLTLENSILRGISRHRNQANELSTNKRRSNTIWSTSQRTVGDQDSQAEEGELSSEKYISHPLKNIQSTVRNLKQRSNVVQGFRKRTSCRHPTICSILAMCLDCLPVFSNFLSSQLLRMTRSMLLLMVFPRSFDNCS
jgi:hypothetical protein